jgi:peroxiredoxin Q/BCP
MADKTVAPGRKVPDFTLPATGGKPFKLSTARGRKLVVYFYPKDNTSGCTQQGIDFRDLHAQFRKAGADILGISPDTLASHEKFKAKYEFPFELAADVDKTACTLFDVYQEKSMYGRKYLGVERSTFLIDEQGVLRQAWRKVKVKDHAAAVLAAVRGS